MKETILTASVAKMYSLKLRFNYASVRIPEFIQSWFKLLFQQLLYALATLSLKLGHIYTRQGLDALLRNLDTGLQSSFRCKNDLIAVHPPGIVGSNPSKARGRIAKPRELVE